MAVSANITAPTGTQSGNFNVTVTFASPVTDFTASDITIAAVSGNGTTGVTFQVTGSGTTYNVPFQLPEDVAGSLRISITGQVTESGVSETVTATARTVVYDNVTNVTVTFGTVASRDGGVLAIPVTFAKAVIAPARSIFTLTRVSGDYLEGVAYRLVGEGTAYTLIIEVPPDRKGSLQVACDGYVVQADTGLWDDITCTVITVTYDTYQPFVFDQDVPAIYEANKRFYVRIAMNVIASGLHLNNVQDVFILEGAANTMGTPTPYKWVGASPPNLHADMPEGVASIGTKLNFVQGTAVATDATLNTRTYRGDGETAPAPESTNELFLVTANDAASKFQISTGSAAYADATVTQALGATGKFLGNITGAETGSAAVVSETTALAYFDANPTQRYIATNTYYFFDGTTLKTITWTPTDWQKLAAPPAGQPTPGTNNFDDDGQWHGEAGQYLLILFLPQAHTTGDFNMTLRKGKLRGPN